MTTDSFKYVFGPVLSRRLGWSLGIDLTPFKTCTYDCVYCQLGRTTNKTVARAEFVLLDYVLEEVRRRLADNPPLDYVSLVGSGEPTLYSRIGEFMSGVRKITDARIAVITNGSLMWMPEVREALCLADLVVPSLDACDKEMFEQVCRPHAEISFDVMVEGLVAFRDEFPKEIWLEVMLNDGVTDAQVERLAGLVRRIRPDRVQLNTAVRPPMLSEVRALSREQLDRFALMLGENAEVVAPVEAKGTEHQAKASADDVYNVMKRHPCSVEDAAKYLGASFDVVAGFVKELLNAGAIEPHERGDSIYYRARIDG